MFSHLCMKYIFFLLAIATIVAGRICTDPNYPVKKTTFCRNQNTFAVVCESRNSLDYKIVDVPCEPDETCVDFARPEDSNPIALCISNQRRSTWDSDGTRGLLCFKSTGPFQLTPGVISIGMTIYDTNSNPTQVTVLDGYVNNVNLGAAYQQHSYSKVHENYVENQEIKLCLAAESEQVVTAVSAVLTNDELTSLRLG